MDQVQKLQTNLEAHGYDVGGIDGVIGAKTYGALCAYIAGHSQTPTITALGTAMAQYFPVFAIDNPLRVVQFIAQTCKETMGFTRFKEMGGPQYFQRYEGRRDLGNTQPGDGLKYPGRGAIQITGRANYQAFENATNIPVIDHPELLEQPDAGILAACLFWTHRSINAPADLKDTERCTHLINGGETGLSERIAYAGRGYAIWGV